ncbi:extracellular solute-binding protein [Devosia sp. 1566]|uniref:ABC transporter substrate-binding protein n=1 Tax=Devosia sp. 1566 TaxID=2499144 RepID=UPI0013E3E508|nr:extracellular solute-binding protein [Devosia sp. 1566]
MTKLTNNGLSRRTVLKSGAAMAGAAALMGLGTRGAFAAEEIRIIMSGGSWGEWVDQTFATPYTDATGIQFSWRYALSQEPLVMAQQSRPQWDLMQSGQMRAGQLGAMGLYNKLTEENLPGVANIHPSFKYDYLVGKCHTPYGLCVNTKQITRPITSWNDLWDPEFKGRVAFPDWGWNGDEVFYALNQVFGGTSEDINPGIEKLKALFVENGAIVANNVEHTRQLLESGEIWLLPYFDGRTAQAAAAGVPVEFVIPEEGGLSWIFNFASIANRPEADTARGLAFLDTTLDAEKQIEFAKLTGYPPTNMEAMANLPPELAHLELSETSLELLGKLQSQLDPMVLFAYRDEYAERWRKEVLGA